MGSMVSPKVTSHMIVNSTFKPARWLTNPHLQTLYSTIIPRSAAVIDDDERLELPDGDFIDLAWATKGLSHDTPLVVLLHGLGGGVRSAYVAGLLRALNASGYRGVLMYFRGASAEPNRLPRVYHSGETGDLTYVLNLLHRREPGTKKAVVGVSLGGNVLLKWLGETGSQSLIQAAVAVSVPFQLEMVADRINQGFSRIYQASLLRKLRAICLRKIDLVNTQLPLTEQDLRSLKTIRAFDEKITAPLHGFKNGQSYYQEASSRQYLGGIETPTLILHALDDPFMLPQAIPEENELSEHVTLELSQYGGHVGFISGDRLGLARHWLEERIPEFLSQVGYSSRSYCQMWCTASGGFPV